MMLGMVRHGDSTTTGGRVLAFDSSMFEDGRRIALSGENATCGVCKGAFSILGSGTDCTDNDRATVLHDDQVLCPCGGNRVIASDTGCRVDRTDALAISLAGAVSASEASSGISSSYDDRFILRDHDGNVLASTAYAVQRATGQFEYGETDANGYTHLLAATASAEHAHVYLAG